MFNYVFSWLFLNIHYREVISLLLHSTGWFDFLFCTSVFFPSRLTTGITWAVETSDSPGEIPCSTIYSPSQCLGGQGCPPYELALSHSGIALPYKKIAVSSLGGGSALSKHQTPFWLLKANMILCFSCIFSLLSATYFTLPAYLTGIRHVSNLSSFPPPSKGLKKTTLFVLFLDGKASPPAFCGGRGLR